jgi:ribonuclease BN (tRNA processing enzyme)
MFDCGIHPGMQGENSLPFLTNEDLDEIDVALITHFHLDHCAAVPYLLCHTTFKVGAVRYGASSCCCAAWGLSDKASANVSADVKRIYDARGVLIGGVVSAQAALSTTRLDAHDKCHQLLYKWLPHGGCDDATASHGCAFAKCACQWQGGTFEDPPPKAVRSVAAMCDC